MYYARLELSKKLEVQLPFKYGHMFHYNFNQRTESVTNTDLFFKYIK